MFQAHEGCRATRVKYRRFALQSSFLVLTFLCLVLSTFFPVAVGLLDGFRSADKDAIYQVIYNLCHNAIKFAGEGGKLKISITNLEDSAVKISVFDEGQIIPKEDITMVFERFYKTDKSRGLDKNGVGLGLYICKTIIDAHGQEIHVESQEGIGTEFWFTLKEGEPQKRKV